IFVAYAHADYAFAMHLMADLKARDLACWEDTRGLRPGTLDWEQAIRAAIRACRAVLLVASRDSRQSRNVNAALSVAEMYRRAIYPVWATGEEWIDCIPLSMSDAHYVDARGQRYAAGLVALVATLGLMGQTRPSAARRGEPGPVVEPRNPYKGLR